MNWALLKRAIDRHFRMKSCAAYQQLLPTVGARSDIWKVSQGEYVDWWQKRACATLRWYVADDKCRVESDLERVVFEQYPQTFFSAGTVACPTASYAGQVWLTIDKTLPRKTLLIEALRREGILNFRVGQEGDFFLSHEVTPILEKMEASLCQGKWRLMDEAIHQIRELVADRMAARGLPLIRIWYHPQIEGTVMKAVFSPRYDVDRAIVNMSKIWRLEQLYGVRSTAYLRTFGPFYGQKEIKSLISLPWCGELALHGEFATNSDRYGGELAAARAEKMHLEEIIDRNVQGLAMHGGEVRSNATDRTSGVIEEAGFDYDSSHGPAPYYLPYKRLTREGILGKTYHLHCHFHDYKVLSYEGDFVSNFVQDALEKIELVYQHHGILVLALHPVYFGFLSYLMHPRNLVRFVSFLFVYLGRILRTEKE
jgi:hypothetical protein